MSRASRSGGNRMDSVKSVRLPPEIVNAVSDRARRENVDESTAIRQLLAKGVELDAVERYRRGEISLASAARLVNTSTREMIEVLLLHGVKGNVTMEMQLEAQETMRRLREKQASTRASSSRS